MTIPSFLRASVFAAILTVPAFAQTYEEPPTLDASTILRPEFASGPLFRVSDRVPTYAGHNQYTIESEYGTFSADGNTLLMQRIREISAIAELRRVSRTDQYKDALKAAAESPVALAKNLVTNPVKTVTGVPKGLWKVMNRAGQSVKELGEKRERNPYEDGAGKDVIGFSKAKRELAADLGVDPYSSNETLQKELNGIGWAAFAGKMTVNLALAPVGGGAGAVISGINLSDSATKALRDTSPNDLRRNHLAKLLDMGIARDEVVTFLNNTAFSPTHATLFVEAVEQLRGVDGMASIVQLASEATDEADALFFQRTAQLLARVNRQTPLASLTDYNGFPVALARDGTLVVAIEWDYAAWTENAAAFIRAIKEARSGGKPIEKHHIVLTGVASQKTRDELLLLKMELTEKALPGPLR